MLEKEQFLAKKQRMERASDEDLRRLRAEVVASLPELSWINKPLEAALFVEGYRRWGGGDQTLFNRVFMTVNDLSVFDELKPLNSFKGRQLNSIKKKKSTKVLFLSSKFGNYVSSQEYNYGILRTLDENIEISLASRRPIDEIYSSKFRSHNFMYVGDLRKICRADRPDKIVDLSGDHYDVLRALSSDFHIADPWGFWTCHGVENSALAWPDTEKFHSFLSKPFLTQGTNRLYLPPEGPLRRYPTISTLNGCRSGRILLGAFCRTSKLNISVIKVWAEIMAAHPTCQLLFAFIQSSLQSEAFVKHVFENFGIDKARISFLPRLDTATYLNHLNQVDINLGAMPEQGGISCMDSLVMGCPYPVCDDLSSNTTASTILKDLGLTDWLAATTHDYKSLIKNMITEIEFFRDLDSRQSVRERLLDSPIARCHQTAKTWSDFLQLDCNSNTTEPLS